MLHVPKVSCEDSREEFTRSVSSALVASCMASSSATLSNVVETNISFVTFEPSSTGRTGQGPSIPFPSITTNVPSGVFVVLGTVTGDVFLPRGPNPT